MTWRKYPDVEPIRRLRNEGRELLGKPVYLTEKRDGENVSLWFDNYAIRISSHNLEEASDDIKNRMARVPEYERALELLKSEMEYHRDIILYGELLKTVSPTRLEPKKKYPHWILFDIFDKITGRFDPYEKVYQLGFQFKIPVVRAFDKFVPPDINDLNYHVAYGLRWCARHKREGLVGKCYGVEEIFFKEKRDIPVLPKIPREGEVKPQYPAMPEDRILRGLQHAYDECVKNGWEWRDKSKAMPLVAKHLTLEAREHNFMVPRNIYNLYIDIPEEKIKT